MLYAERVVDLLEARGAAVQHRRGLRGRLAVGAGPRCDDKRVHLVRGDRTLFDVHGRSAEQRIAVDLLADPSVGILSLGGAAGTGKSVLALAAGLDAVMEQRTHKRGPVFRPLYAVGARTSGSCPAPRPRR